MYHYVYLLEFPDGMKYIGLHSTKIEPKLDTCYLGSGGALPVRDSSSCTKTILAEFDTRAEAAAYEIEEILNAEALTSENYYNLRLRTHDKHGSRLSDEHKMLISKTHKGRSRGSYGLKYRGEGRTPAQKAGSIRAGQKIKGTKCPAKGKPGTSNQGFVPWYYVTPTGVYVEIHDRTKAEVASELGLTIRQIRHGFHYTNEHRKGLKSPRKGWIFGNLPRPELLGED